MASFEFFRKHQKLILYTAGLFALLTFSITGAMTAFFDQMRGGGFRGASMLLADGRRAYVTVEDHRIAQALANQHRPIVPQLIPTIGGEKASEGDRVEILAAVRRLAIEYGIDGSVTEARAAVKHLVDVWPKQDGKSVTEADLARMSGLSGDQYDLLLRESLRISNFLRMFVFAADNSDAQMVERLAREMKLLTVKVATLDKKLIEDQLKGTDISDADLEAWLAGLGEVEKGAYQDTNRVSVKVAGLKLAEFDAAAFAAELKDKTFDDKAIEARYNLDREILYRKEKKEGEDPPADPYMPLADVKDAVLKRLQAEGALAVVIDKLRQQMGVTLQPLVDARGEAMRKLAAARTASAEADQKSSEKADDEALKKAAADAKAALEAAEKGHKEAEAAVDTARRAFDLEAELAKATTAKLKIVAVAEPKNADGLKDLAEFGPWNESWQVASIELPGDLCTRVQNTKEGVFLVQVLDVVKRPLKEFATIKDKLKEDYYKKKADEQAKGTITKFEEALKRLAKEAKKVDIDKLEADLTVDVTKKFDEWKSSAQAKLTKADEMRRSLERDRESMPYKRWQAEFERLEKDLAAADAKRTAIETEARKETDKKIEDMVKSARKDVIDAAAAEAGLTIDTIGPIRKDADSLPRFQEDRPARERFLLGSVKQLKEGEATDMLEDFTNRAHHMAVVSKIETGSAALVARHELMRARERYASEVAGETLQQSFTLDALRKGWGYQRTEGEPDEAKSAKTSGETGKSGGGDGANGTGK